MKLQVSENRRFLVTDEGKPFFYLGDTAWQLFKQLSREEADLYLETRARQGFTVIQAVALAEFDGITTPNAYGDLALHDADPTRPNEAYFRHVDTIVNKAAAVGLHIGMLPTWGDKWNKKWGAGPEIFTPQNAAVYGEWLGRRYKDAPIIWILGGDRPIENDTHRAIIRAMAAGLARGDGENHLMTLHPSGGRTSAEWFHDEAWLDFNMLQSGHGARNNANHAMMARDYERTPPKPCLDGEPNYEDHAVNWSAANGYFDDYDVRKAAYWALFAGAHGHTYGCHDIWMMFDPKRANPSFHFPARTAWQDALHLPGATQMIHARRLLESRPYLLRVPDQTLLLSPPGDGGAHVQATRASDGSYAFVYLPLGQPVAVDLAKLAVAQIRAHWFDPRTGAAAPAGAFPPGGRQEFTPPSSGPGHDWVLVLDDATRGFSTPGGTH